MSDSPNYNDFCFSDEDQLEQMEIIDAIQISQVLKSSKMEIDDDNSTTNNNGDLNQQVIKNNYQQFVDENRSQDFHDFLAHEYDWNLEAPQTPVNFQFPFIVKKKMIYIENDEIPSPFPLDIWRYIWSKLPLQDQVNLSVTCKSLAFRLFQDLRNVAKYEVGITPSLRSGIYPLYWHFSNEIEAKKFRNFLDYENHWCYEKKCIGTTAKNWTAKQAIYHAFKKIQCNLTVNEISKFY